VKESLMPFVVKAALGTEAKADLFSFPMQVCPARLSRQAGDEFAG
jgi:hypothetical protein